MTGLISVTNLFDKPDQCDLLQGLYVLLQLLIAKETVQDGCNPAAEENWIELHLQVLVETLQLRANIL